jgi:GTP-binding protein
MRREGYEFDVSKPEVIFREDPETGEMLEPVEEVHVEVADDSAGTVFELMGARHGEMLDMHSDSGTTYIRYRIPTRFLIGFQSQFVRATSGMGQMHSLLAGYEPIAPYAAPQRQFGSLVADQPGTTTAYALVNAQQRGSFFIPPGTDVYEGMVVGEHIRSGDLAINVAKAKHLTNHRAKPSETTAGLTPHRVMSLDDCIEFLADDELLEVTPESLRLRKRILNNHDRLKEVKRKKDLVAG